MASWVMVYNRVMRVIHQQGAVLVIIFRAKRQLRGVRLYV